MILIVAISSSLAAVLTGWKFQFSWSGSSPNRKTGRSIINKALSMVGRVPGGETNTIRS